MRLKPLLLAAVAAVLSACASAPTGGLRPRPAPATFETYRTGQQHYWDGEVAASMQCNGATPVVPAEYMHPELMAIGDSLYNGMQSGRMNWLTAEWSAPVLVALRLDLIDEQQAGRLRSRRFYVPQYPAVLDGGLNSINFGVPLEDMPPLLSVTGASTLLGLGGRMADDIHYLSETYRPPNRRPMVENIAFSGANSIDLVKFTPAEYRAAARTLRERGEGEKALTYANAAFVLDPMHTPCLENLTALEQVVLRKPRRLIVSVGSNNGIWLAGFRGQKLGDEVPCEDHEHGPKKLIARCMSSMTTFLRNQLLTDLNTMIETLAGEPDIRHVYFNGLIEPSRSANLVPDSDQSVGRDNRYSQSYRVALFPNLRPVSGEDVAETDAYVVATNRLIQEALDRANVEYGVQKFHYVDVNAAIARYDFKACAGRQPLNHTPDQAVRMRAGCVLPAETVPLNERHGLVCGFVRPLDNFPIESQALGGEGRRQRDMCEGITQGGLFSLDNMHPSSVGYGILARTVRLRMEAAATFRSTSWTGVTTVRYIMRRRNSAPG